MENITIAQDLQSDSVWTVNIGDKKLYLNMPYDVFCREFAEYIGKSYKNTYDNVSRIIVDLQIPAATIYGQEAKLTVFFVNHNLNHSKEHKIYKITIEVIANNIRIESPHTGIQRYQQQVQQMTQEIAANAAAQFGEPTSFHTNIGYESFGYTKNGVVFGGSVDRDNFFYHLWLIKE